MKDKLVSIGKVTNFQGIKGEVKVGFTQGKEEQLEDLDVFFYELPSGFRTLTKESLRFHKKFAVIKFKEINSVDEAIEIKGKNLYTEINQVRKCLGEDEYLFDDLAGMSVYDDKGVLVGEVDFAADQGSGSILVIKNNDKQYLVPFIKQFVTEVDAINRKITIKPIKGLLD